MVLQVYYRPHRVKPHKYVRNKEKKYSVWLQNQLISAGLETVKSNTENLCITSYLRHFCMNSVQS